MKNNQKLTITVENGYAVFTRTDATANRYAIPPFASLFKTIWTLLEAKREEYPDAALPEPTIVIHYNGFTYHWNHTQSLATFGTGLLSEEEFATSILVESNKGEE